MILWKNLRMNLGFSLFGSSLVFFMAFSLWHNYKYYDKLNRSFIIWAVITISIFVISSILIISFNNPCIMETVPMMNECVACLDSSKTAGIECEFCKQTALCAECYILWNKKSDTCPLCRNFYYKL